MAGQHRTLAALAAGVVLVGTGAYAAAGQVGVFVVAVVAAAGVLLAVRLRVPPPDPETAGEAQPVRAAHEFTSFADIHNTLHLAMSSRYHFDQVTGPRLWRLLVTLLARRRRVDVSRDPGPAREVLGPDLWPLLDPTREMSSSTRGPGVSLDTIGRIVGRLEDL